VSFTGTIFKPLLRLTSFFSHVAIEIRHTHFLLSNQQKPLSLTYFVHKFAYSMTSKLRHHGQ